MPTPWLLSVATMPWAANAEFSASLTGLVFNRRFLLAYKPNGMRDGNILPRYGWRRVLADPLETCSRAFGSAQMRTRFGGSFHGADLTAFVSVPCCRTNSTKDA